MGQEVGQKKTIVLNSPMCVQCKSRAAIKSKPKPKTKDELCYACIRAMEGQPLFFDAGADDHKNSHLLWGHGSPSDDEDLSDCHEDDECYAEEYDD